MSVSLAPEHRHRQVNVEPWEEGQARVGALTFQRNFGSTFTTKAERLEATMALRDTLKAAAAREDADAAFEAGKPLLIEQWQASIITIQGQIANWLAEFVADHTLEIELEQTEVREELLGAYPAQVMTLRAGKRVVRIQPIARIVIGSVGRMDMYRQGFPNPNDRYRLIRTIDDANGGWRMRPPAGDIQGPADLIDLTQETFEAALDTLLR